MSIFKLFRNGFRQLAAYVDVMWGGETDGSVPVWNATLGTYVPGLPSGGAPGGAAGGVLAGTYPNPTLAGSNSVAVTWTGAQDFAAGIKSDTIATHTASADLVVKVGNSSNRLIWKTGGDVEFARLKSTSGLSLGLAHDLDTPGILFPYGGAGGIYVRNALDNANTAALTFDGINTDSWALTTAGATRFQVGSGGFIVRDVSLNVAMQVNSPSFANSTGLLLMVDRGGVQTLSAVTIGAADSGGAGFRALRVAN